jgi:hypothetical protein
MARLQSVGRELAVSVSHQLSPDARRRMIAGIARRGLREAQEVNRAALGAVPPHQTFVDGQKGRALEQVNPDRGVIALRTAQ